MIQGRLLWAATLTLVAFGLSAQAREFPAVPGEYVVTLKQSVSIASRMTLEQNLGVQVKKVINKEHGVLLVQKSMVETRDSAIQSLANSSLVRTAEPNYIYKVVGGSTSLPTDGRLGQLWGLINTGGVYSGDGGSITGKPGVDIGATEAWKIETGSRDVVIGVIDTGVNYNNPDIKANIFVNEAELNGRPGVDDDGNGLVDDVHGWDFAGKDADPMDVYGHGTHVSGTIGAVANNGDGIVGVAWNVRILPIRFLGDDGSGSLADAILAIDYATKMKVTMTSNSWGGGGFSQALQDSIARARAAGILFVAAAGNSSNDNDASPEYPASYPLDNVISVAAIDPTGALADFSNYGKTTVHIAAPGVNIVSHTMRGIESWSGTSMATPHVSGVAALLYSQDMTQSYSVIKDRILKSARTLGSLRGRVATGGMVDAYHALMNTVAPLDPEDPFNWQKDVQSASTAHPYASNARQEFTFTVPGATSVAVFFSRFETESGYDKVTFYDKTGKMIGTMSGRLGEAYGPSVPGDTVKIQFTTDGSVNQYGFDVGGIAFK